MAQKDKQPIIKHPDEVAKAIEILFMTPYFNKKKLYWENFIRGMAFAAGGVIGASILIALLLGLLSLFDTVPFIGPFVDNAKDSIESQTSR